MQRPLAEDLCPVLKGKLALALSTLSAYPLLVPLRPQMRWKLTRGKWRPLLKYAEAAAESEVRAATQAGLSLLHASAAAGTESPASKVEEALEAVAKLKVSGRARASQQLSEPPAAHPSAALEARATALQAPQPLF